MADVIVGTLAKQLKGRVVTDDSRFLEMNVETRTSDHVLLIRVTKLFPKPVSEEKLFLRGKAMLMRKARQVFPP